jgi:hypothetical protein
MTRSEAEQEKWAQCPPGTLTGIAALHARRRRRAAAFKLGGAAMVVLLCLSVGWRVFRHDGQMQEFNFGGIACHDVQHLMPDYMMGKLPEDTSDRIRRHLAECPHCQDVVRRMKEQDMKSDVGRTAPSSPRLDRGLASSAQTDSRVSAHPVVQPHPLLASNAAGVRQR